MMRKTLLRHVLHAALLTVPFASSACGPFIDVVPLDEASRARYRTEIRYYEQVPEAATVIQPIRATSCKQKIWDPGASQEDAIDQLRAKAAGLGANGISRLVCDPPEGMTLSKNCWSAFTCRADAIRMKE
jgi:hypothetical protein